MANISQDNKRIVRNTLFLYIRMLFMVLVGLYTSRIILQVLGIQDFGIYNVVGGVIAMLSFLQGSLSAASSRYITYDLGKGDMKIMKMTFGNIMMIHLVLAGIVLILGETIGLWFVMEKLKIPSERHIAAIWVYQFSIFTSMISIISVPYNAAIIAHEKMSAFAYISIYEAVAKLIVVYLLLVIPIDKLVIYAALLFGVQCSSRIIYNIYCFRHLEETRAKLNFDKRLFKEIFTFAGWTMNGNLAVLGYTQGLNIILNLFFGPTVNAARGIAVQVQTISQQFCNNFQMAFNPQITKSYAQNNLKYMHKLLIISSKFSFFIMLFITLPLMLEAELVLHWWLGIVPEHTTNFLRLILCISLLFTLSNPIIIAVHATGKLKKFQLIEGSILLSIVPISYLLLRLYNVPPESVFIVHLIIQICTLYAELKIVLPMIHMKIKTYVYNVIFRILFIIIFVPIFPIYIYMKLSTSIYSFVIVCLTCIICLGIGIYTLGCNVDERLFVRQQMNRIIRKCLCKFGLYKKEIHESD